LGLFGKVWKSRIGEYAPSCVCPDANLKDGMVKYSTPVESTSVAGIMEVVEDQLRLLKRFEDELRGLKGGVGPF
jgi:hypothetical protein